MVPHHGPGFRRQARPVLLLPDHQQLAGVADDRARRAGRARREQRPRDAAGGHAGGRQGLLVEAVGPELDRADGGEGGGVDLREGGGGGREDKRRGGALSSSGREEEGGKGAPFSLLLFLLLVLMLLLFLFLSNYRTA